MFTERVLIIVVLVSIALAGIVGALLNREPTYSSPVYSATEIQQRWERCMQDPNMRPGFCDVARWAESQPEN